MLIPGKVGAWAIKEAELLRIPLPKLFGKSERVPNRIPKGVQEGKKGSRPAASWRQKPTLEKPPAIFQTVSPRTSVNKGQEKGRGCYEPRSSL